MRHKWRIDTNTDYYYCNTRLFNAHFDLDVNQIYQQWEEMLDDNAARSAAQVAELCEMRDSINRMFLDKPEIMSIIEAIVTD